GRFASATEQHALVRRHVERLAVDRPVVLVLEEVHWSLESLAFVHHLLEAQADSPARVLVVLTAATDLAAGFPAENAALQRIVADGAHAIDVGPLDEDERAELVRELIGLEGVLAAQ